MIHDPVSPGLPDAAGPAAVDMNRGSSTGTHGSSTDIRAARIAEAMLQAEGTGPAWGIEIEEAREGYARIAMGERIVAVAEEQALAGRSGVYGVQLRGEDGRMIATFQGLSRSIGGAVVGEV